MTASGEANEPILAGRTGQVSAEGSAWPAAGQILSGLPDRHPTDGQCSQDRSAIVLYSLIATVILCVAALVLNILAVINMERAHRGWEEGSSETPAIVRWVWMSAIACCALTSVMMMWVSVYQLIWRGVDGAEESSIAARMAVYAGGAAYAIAWLRGGVTIDWARWGRRAQKLLLPGSASEGPEEEAQEAAEEEEEAPCDNGNSNDDR